MSTSISFIRKVHTRKGNNSLLFNIPMEIANELNLKKGEYMIVKLVGEEIIIKKTKLELEENKDA